MIDSVATADPRSSIGRGLAAAILVLLSGWPAAATDVAVKGFLTTIRTECGSQLELGETECRCVSERVTAELSPLEIEYTAARISGNDPEVERIRGILGFMERISILIRVTSLIEDCADGAPINNPL